MARVDCPYIALICCHLHSDAERYPAVTKLIIWTRYSEAKILFFLSARRIAEEVQVGPWSSKLEPPFCR